jgi:hypothetical protein
MGPSEQPRFGSWSPYKKYIRTVQSWMSKSIKSCQSYLIGFVHFVPEIPLEQRFMEVSTVSTMTQMAPSSIRFMLNSGSTCLQR